MNWLTRLFPLSKGLRKTIALSGKPVEIICTAQAQRALSQRETPLVVEMELAFACFARKSVRFHEQLPQGELAYVTDKLAIYAHAVIPYRCEANGATNEPRIEARRFTPRFLRIDWRNGEWVGEYDL